MNGVKDPAHKILTTTFTLNTTNINNPVDTNGAMFFQIVDSKPFCASNTTTTIWR